MYAQLCRQNVRHGAPEHRLVIIPNVLFLTLEWDEHGSSKATARNDPLPEHANFKMLITEAEVTEALTMAALSGQQHSSPKEGKQDKCEGEPTHKTRCALKSSQLLYSNCQLAWRRQHIKPR